MRFDFSSMKPSVKVAVIAGLAAAGMLAGGMVTALAQQQPDLKAANRIVAVVDDDPISQYEVDQRMKLIRALGDTKTKDDALRKRVLERLVDERLQRQEAKRLKVKVKDDQIKATINNMATRARQTVDQVKARLAKRGVRFKTLEDQVRATVAWNSVVRKRFARRITVDKEAIELKFNSIQKNPQKPKIIAVLRQVILPVEKGFPGMVRSRFNEAMALRQKFRGCGSLPRLTSQIFNVQLGPVRNAPLEALHPQLRKLLRKMGPGRISPPSATPKAIQMIAYCSNKKIEPPAVTKKQVENQLMNQQFGLLAMRHLRDLRRDAVVEYR